VIAGQASAVPGPGPERWRLHSTPGARTFDQWTDILAQTHLRFDVRSTQRTPATFYGAITRWRFGDLSLVDLAASPFFGRSAGSGEAAAAGVFGLMFVRRGVERVRERTRELSLRAGAVALWDGERPVEIEVLEPLLKRTVIFPRERVLAVCPRLAEAPSLPPLAGSASARLLIRYLDVLGHELGELDETGRAGAADAALELLRAAVAPALPSSRSARRAAMCAEVRRYIRGHLQDARLDPERIAVAHAMSVRALHALFEGTGESVGSVVRRERLNRAHDDLAQPSGGTVTEIAFRWGFRDPAHFARVFKHRFERTPTEVRRDAQLRAADAVAGAATRL
jgi:AraC family transcriptional regulator, positive regulator of tynA and feaB